MLTARIKIGNGGVTDTRNYGFIYLDSDKVVGAPIKGYEATSYPEEEGEHILPRTVEAAFDYKVKFFVEAKSLRNANALIAAFNSALCYKGENDEKDIMTYNQVEFYNDYKRHKIVGYPNPIAEATDFWRDKYNQVQDIVVVEWTIRVPKPSLCDFSLS